MELGQPASQHYSTESWKERKRWVEDRDSCYSSAEAWKDRKGWMDGGQSTAGAPSTALSLPSTSVGSNGNVDKVLFQNLVEMIPLVESFMDQQGNKSFSRHASLVYTPTPAREWPMKAVESPSKGRRGRQLFRGKRGEMKESLLWDDHENLQFHDSREMYKEEIPMLSFASDYQTAQNVVSKAEMLQLQSQIEELEQKLREKDCQLQSAESNVKQSDFLELQRKFEDLQKELSEKENQIQSAHTQLSDKQHEIAGLHSLLEKAEADSLSSNRKAADIEEELGGLRFQVAALVFQLENTVVHIADDLTRTAGLSESQLAESSSSTSHTEPEEQWDSQFYKMEVEDMELMRRKYLAAVIAARENPGEELLSLVAELRSQLQAYLMRPSFASVANELYGSQAARFSLC